MPVALTFPGVYIEEIPSGVRTIVGVPTSIAAFMGRTVSGPVNMPVTINGFGDFERVFGGLAADMPLGYAVKDFYQNGGAQAIIVRLYKKVSPGTTGVVQFTVSSLKLEASSPGTWANDLTATIDTDNITEDVASRFGLAAADLFNLAVLEKENGRTISQEKFLNLHVKADKDVPSAAGRAQRADRVIMSASQLVRVPLNSKGAPDLPTKSPVPPGTGAPTPAGTGGGGNNPPPTSPPPLDGLPLEPADFIGSANDKTGLNALDTADIFNILCIPADTFGGDTPNTVYNNAAEYCKARRAMLIVDSPAAWSANPAAGARTAVDSFLHPRTPASTPPADDLSITGEIARNAALYFPRLLESDPLSNGQFITTVPCGAVAGVMARTDVTRGVWKAPAGLDATINGIAGFDVNLTNDENGQLNPLGINCLRSFPISGRVVWGARTMRGADQSADDYKYVPVRRLALFLEESLYRGTQWAVFEPNDAPLWSQIRLDVGAFLHNLFIQGAFQGSTPKDAYFVKCDSTTTTQNDIDLGIVNVVIGFAPLKPAEFVVLQIQQIAGNILT